MAAIPENEFMARIGVASPEKTTTDAPAAPSPINPDNPAIGFDTPSAEPISLTPATDEVLKREGISLERSKAARPVSVEPSKWDTLSRLGARPGIPFDTTSGVPFRVRVAAEKEPTPAEKIASYKIAYGDENVRLNQFGQPIVTTTDEKGRTVDRLANPIGLDATDAATFVASAPEIAGSILPLIATRGATLGPGALKALATLVLSTGGAELAGGAKDMYQRWLRGAEPDVPEIAKRHAVSGSVGLMTGAGLGGAGFVLGRVISPFNAPGRLQLDARAARDMLNAKYGLDLKLSAAETTGSPILQAGEALESQKPGSRSGFALFREKNQAEMTKLRDLATGALPDQEEAGQRVLSAIKDKLSPLEFDVSLASQEAQRAAEDAIKTKVGTPIDKVAVGKAIDIGAKVRKAGFDLVNDANYNAFYNNPKATERVIGGAPLKQAVDDMIASLPAVEKDVQVPTGLVGPNQRPIFTTATETIPVDTPVRSRLEEISAKLADNGRISINDLKQIRTDVDNAVKTGEAVPGVKEGRLKHYYSALSTAIDDGLKQINDPALTKAWETATGYYKANVGKFEKAGIAELFRDPINAMGPTELVERATGSPDIYDAYKTFFGANSPQLKGIQQAAKDNVLNLGSLGKSVDAAEFARRLEALDTASPQLLKDAFGKDAELLRREALVMMRAQGQQIPVDELNQALSTGTLSSERLKEMITAETRRKDAYNNTLIQQLSEGTIKPDKIKPTQVVDRFVFDKKTQPEHLAELVRAISPAPDTLEDLRRLTFKKVLDNATAIDTKSGNSVLSGLDLHNMLADENLSKRLKTVLGDASFNDLVSIKDYLMPGIRTQEAFKSAGGLVAGSQINQLLGHGDLKAIPQFVKNFILSVAYTSGPVRAYLSNDVLRQEGKALVVNTAIASEPFTRALVKTFSKNVAEQVQSTIKGHVDQMAYRNPNEAQPGPSKSGQGIPWGDFLKRIGATNQPAQ